MPGEVIMKKIIRIFAIAGLVLAMGCSNGSDPIQLPSDLIARTFDSSGGALNYSSLDVGVVAPEGAVGPGEVVFLTVQLAPPNLPDRGYAGNAFERIGWVMLANDGDPAIVLMDEIAVTMPLADDYDSNATYAVFQFNPEKGKWVRRDKSATITDDGMHAIFTADSFGTWGIFKVVPFTVDAHAKRTTAQAPASISLKAIIDGGSPPYTIVWYYGDDSDPEGGLAVSHLYEFPMKYTATCVVIDSQLKEVSDSIDLNLY